MDISRFEKVSDNEWRVKPHGAMRVPAVLFADEALIHDMDDKVYEQLINVAMLPGIVGASYAMPDAHWGYGFPIGGVAAFDASEGVVSAGGVGFDISCGVRSLTTGIGAGEIERHKRELADALFAAIPAGVGSRGALCLDAAAMKAMLEGGASWAVGQGYGEPEDLARVEERGRMQGSKAECVSEKARHRQQREMGTLGSGNHYLEVQRVTEIFDAEAASAYGLRVGEIIVTIHCGSRGLGHQIGSEFLREMAIADPQAGIHLPDRELACAPIRSELGQRYLGAMRSAINCALANRQIICHLTRRVFRDFFPEAHLGVLFDVSHNTCKEEHHRVNGEERVVFVHRKGATRAFGPGHSALPAEFASVGQPVLIGGSMGTTSYVLAGTSESESHAWSSACHGAGRAMSRRAASRRWNGRSVVDELAHRGILVRSPSMRGVAEEAPLAYKDVTAVVDCAHRAGLARKVAQVTPMVCIKG